ncbi:MAG: autotransporter-associated beta strand repeat-containing protein [Pirellulales bacterium]
MRRDRGLLFFALLWLGFPSFAPAATFTVTNTANSGAGSLRQAVIDANASPGADTINVNVTGTVTLSTSLPALTGDIDLNGPASGSFTVTGGASVAIFAGAAAVGKSAAGTVVLSAASSNTGGTRVSGGVLQGNTTSLQGDIANNANVTLSQTTTGTYAGIMSGTGSLTKAGTGTVTLSGANTYSGGTTISAGTLQGDTTSLQGDIVDNATVNFNQATAGTYTGNISGTGAIVKQGAGTLTLTGTNTNTGTTTISAGTLQGNTANLRNNITNNAAAIFDQGSAGTYSGVMSGTGTLTKQGAGTLTLTGANTYSGGTTVSAGTLQGSVTAVRGNITNNSTVVFDQTAAGTYSSVMSGTGAREAGRTAR